MKVLFPTYHDDSEKLLNIYQQVQHFQVPKKVKGESLDFSPLFSDSRKVTKILVLAENSVQNLDSASLHEKETYPLS